jgi:hypothetical protein
MKKALLLAAVLTYATAQLFGLELTEGRLRLTLHESSGRFSVDYKPDLESERYVGLLDNTDPRTSDVRVRDGNNVYRLGDAPRFDLDTEREAGGRAAFVWTSGTLVIRQSFSFVTSDGARLANGVLVRLSVENVSEVTRNIEVRYLFDTHLAESRQAHFITAARDRIRSEAAVTPSASNTWWATPDPEMESVGFQQLIAGDGITRPERVVFGNWKRLSEATYDYTVQEERTFSLLPYSIDDSAAAAYYPEVSLEPGETHVITTLVGNLDRRGYSEYSVDRTESAELLDSAAQEAPPELDLETAQRELVSVNDLLDEIDTLLSGEEELDAEDVEVLEEILRQLENRKEAYDTR